MYFESGGMYHVYNQGNNRQTVFFNRNNYLYFLRKLRIQILPFADILAWCLMPNHFHLMIYVKQNEIPKTTLDMTRRCLLPEDFSPDATASRVRTVTLNASIGVLLSSYTRGINNQEKRTGSLFRKETNAICLNDTTGQYLNWYKKFGATILNVEILEWQYPQSCMDYIHFNPVKAKLVKNPEDLEFSSYNDLIGIRNGTLVNKERIVELKLKV